MLSPINRHLLFSLCVMVTVINPLVINNNWRLRVIPRPVSYNRRLSWMTCEMHERVFTPGIDSQADWHLNTNHHPECHCLQSVGIISHSLTRRCVRLPNVRGGLVFVSNFVCPESRLFFVSLLLLPVFVFCARHRRPWFDPRRIPLCEHGLRSADPCFTLRVV